VLLAPAGSEQGGRQPGDDGRHQHDVHQLVVAGRGAEDGSGGAAAVDQDPDPDQRADSCDASEHEGLDVVALLGEPDGRGPTLRDEQADHVPDDHDEDSEVEQRTADAQQA